MWIQRQKIHPADGIVAATRTIGVSFHPRQPMLTRHDGHFLSSVQQLVQMGGCLTTELTCPRTFRRLSMGISIHDERLTIRSALIGVLLTIHREPHLLIDKPPTNITLLSTGSQSISVLPPAP